MATTQRPVAARRPRHRVLITVVILMTLAAGGAFLDWAVRHNGPASRTSAALVQRTSSPATPTAPSTGTPTAPGTDLTALAWVDFHGVELPVSRSAGPRAVRGGLAWGFADTPLGALLAAVNIGVRANAQWGPGIFGPTIRGQVTGPGAAMLLAACQSSYDQASQAEGVPSGQPLGRADVTEEAFRWVTYTAADATVDVVSAGLGAAGVTARAVTRIEVQWSGGDWRVIAPPGGDWGNSAAPLPSLTGYTAFPGLPS
jgi:hypothetical protein